jgi:hypothetical protein
VARLTERRGPAAAPQRRGGAPVVGARSDRHGELILAEGFPMDLRKREGRRRARPSPCTGKTGDRGGVAAMALTNLAASGGGADTR